MNFLLECIAHECTHAKQTEFGELDHKYDHNTNRWVKFWKGKRYARCAWKNRPWEIEALENEKSLTDKYIKFNKPIDAKIK